ncbi:MAG TPA: hypothetical protein DIW31_03815, partial [Bacteroidales bacterium]|nr:hypothetical protein [Bacteroidales bacterium]
MIKKILLILLILKASILLAQTPGMVIKSVTAPGKAILDPDGDGYVSMKTSGVQIGFLTNDIAESEIPYAPIVKPDPQGDPLAGPSCLYNEIVGTDAAGNNAVMSYFDGTNLLFRFRLGGYAANSKGYSLLIDTDQKFGFTGPNADPNAVVGNPGFEVEIVLETNFGVEVYKVDGTASPINVIPFSTNPYSTNCQKSMALTTACSDPDYFYDFYIPFSQLTGIPGLTIDANTPLRMVAVTSMSPHPAIGNSAISDVGGVTTGSNLDDIYSSIIDEITPTSTNNINNDGQLDRSTCPFIDPVGISNTAITGTTTETSGTVTVYVYQSNGTNLLGSASTAFSAAGNWSINVSSLSPSVILAAGQVVKATVTATGKGISYSNCNPVIVSDCSVQTSTPLASEITKISSGKGYSLTISRPIGTKVYLYTSNYALRTVSDLKNSVTNPFITTTNPQTFTFECQTGNCFGSDVYYFRYEEPGKCISPYYVSCHYASGGTSATPTISTSTITTATTSISGNGTAASSQINIYANDIQIATATSGASAPYAWTANVSSLTTCQVITARQIVSGQCLSDPSAGVTVTRSAIKPTISFNGCSATSPVTSISGYSSEANGTTIMLYTPNSSGTSLGSTTVSSGSWTKTGLNLTSGTIVAKVTSGSCLSPSPDSDPITISTKTDISGYSIAINPATEGETTVSGTISGGTYPVTIKVYVDETLVGAGIAVNSAGSWSVSGLNTFDLAVGSKVQVTLTGTGCESSLSSTYQTVGCSNPSDKTITSSSTTICSNSNGTITVQNSQSGVIYTPVLNDGVTLYGYGICGTGFDIDLVTYALTSNTTIKVKATKFPSTSCSAILSGSISFTVNPTPQAPSGASNQTFCSSGTTTLADLSVTAPSGCSLVWYNASTGGSVLPSTTNLVSGTTYYALSQNNTTGCTSTTRTAITVQSGTPAAPTAAANQSYCSGATVDDLTASLSGPGTISWYASSSGGSALATSTALVSGSTYYAETNHNSCVSSSRTAVTVTLYSSTTITGQSTAAQTQCQGGAFSSISVNVTGAGLTYQWYSNTSLSNTGGTPITGATSSSYTPSASTEGTLYYYCIVTGSCGSPATSNVSEAFIVNALPAAPTATATQSFCGSATVANLAATAPVGSAVKWYAASSDGSTLAAGTALVNSTTYYAESENTTSLCVSSSRTAVTVTINALPAAPTATATQSFCGSATVADLSATVPVNSIMKWYAASSGGSALAGATALVNGSTYYAESENTTTLCVSSLRTAVTVTINVLPAAPTATATQSFCGSATVGNLAATAPVGSNVKWYAASSGGSALEGATALVNGSTYYTESENTTSLCVSSSRTAVTVTINALPAEPTATATQSFCGSATVANLAATAPVGSTVKWYAASSGGSALAAGTALVNGSTYYAESENTTTLCVSNSRTAMTVAINSLPAVPTATATQSFCGSATIVDLSATAPVGSTVKWYAASSGGSTLEGATALVNGSTYYTESENTISLCVSSSRTAVTVTINALPAAPTATATQSFCGSATVADLSATVPVGSIMKWYAASSGGSALAEATALVNGTTYYAESENTTSLCVS